jgi:hypothetical protein
VRYAVNGEMRLGIRGAAHNSEERSSEKRNLNRSGQANSSFNAYEVS